MKTSADFSCPYCGSRNTRSYRAIWEAGTISTTSHGNVDTGKFLAGRVRIESQSVSEEAKIAEKPGKTVNIRMGIGLGLTIVGPPLLFIQSFLLTYG